MLQKMQELLAIPGVRALAIVLGSILGAYLVELTVHRALVALAKKTETDVDDKIVAVLRRPVFLTAIFAGLYWATGELRSQLSDTARVVTYGIIWTCAILLWAGAIMRIGTLILGALSRRAREGALVQPSSVPLFDIFLKVLVVVAAAYFVFVAWRIDVTAWLASAGIIGIAVGFGAKDTLSNLFAGIFILADAPYRVGDFIVLDDGTRGRVTGIGMRSTRILTIDDIEVTIPNGIIGNSRILNEAGGPSITHRLPVSVSAAYGSDVDQVREVLLSCAEGLEQLSSKPAPEVRFVEFGDSGLHFLLLAWVREPAMRERVLDLLNTRIYKAFASAGIEIPFHQHDVYIKRMPARAAAV